LTGLGALPVEKIPILESVVVDLYCNIGTFAYGALALCCNWYGWDPRPASFLKGMSDVTG
jgi:hypothetical protein